MSARRAATMSRSLVAKQEAGDICGEITVIREDTTGGQDGAQDGAQDGTQQPTKSEGGLPLGLIAVVLVVVAGAFFLR